MNPDVELLAKSIARDPRAFGELFDRHSTAVFRFAYSLTKDETEAQDVVQETFLTTWRKLADIRLAGDSLLPWLLVTARNHARNLARDNVKHDAASLDEYIGNRDAHASAEQESALREEIDWVFEEIRRLSDIDQRIVDLVLYEGSTYKEAALRLGLTPGSVRKRVERTRTHLRDLRELRDEDAHDHQEVRR